MELSKLERKEAIEKLRESTSVAKYAFEKALKKKKITDEQLLKMVESLEILAMLKPVISENRSGQKKRTTEANVRTRNVEKELASLKQQFVDFENSEIFQLGKWLLDKLHLSGKARKEGLIEYDLVHLQDYQGDIGELVGTLQEHNRIANQQLSENELIIIALQNTIDNQKKIIEYTDKEAIEKFGLNTWKEAKLKVKRRMNTNEAS